MSEENNTKHKTEVLREFVEILYKHDVMQAKSPKKNEYEVEALSILARMCEVHVHLAEDENDALEATHAIVAQTFQFWFADDPALETINFEQLSIELLTTFAKSFPMLKHPLDKDENASGDDVTVNTRR